MEEAAANVLPKTRRPIPLAWRALALGKRDVAKGWARLVTHLGPLGHATRVSQDALVRRVCLRLAQTRDTRIPRGLCLKARAGNAAVPATSGRV